ncbi:class I adenylate-forming enzyme family protein [Alloalcanivorax xenomutans]|uniref:class I adenylate-forming enzyme family protein n=1 Tax=Alloalcanivorax xenomutans TaxID=1094342 RepID=UPI001F1FD188|nr:class I adenylate-forming enzyme family protein [Alloalcanivorax xenomutans]MCE7521923.1 acyl--CoA ligase [Alloalcanivorax xenomutans]
MSGWDNNQTVAQRAPGTDTPALTLEQAVDHITSTDPRFAVTEADIRGQRYPVFANAPAHLREVLQSVETVYGDRDVLVYGDERWDYPRLVNEVNRLARALSELGVRPGDRVALAMRNYPEFPLLLLAITAVGAVVVPMNAWWSGEELAFALEDCGARVVFADHDRYQRIEPFSKRLGLSLFAVRDVEGEHNYSDLLARVPEASWPTVSIDTDDDFAVLYSSGSTGRPKGVVLTHRGLVSAVYSLIMLRLLPALMDPEQPAPTRPPCSLVVTPLFHVTALNSNLIQGLAAGATLNLMYKWDPEEAIRIINAEQVTRFVGVPTQSAELMEAARRLNQPLPSLEFIGGGGAKRPAAQVGRLASAFPAASIASGWGMTETNALGIIISGDPYVENPEAAGRLTPPLQEMRIVDEQDRPLPPGEVGELLVRSAANMRCYLNQPEATAAAMRDGWLYTGDMARANEDGLIYIVDRKKDIIIRGGENIACLEVEDALYQHPEVAEACVFSVPDERLGEIVGAMVVLKQEGSVDEAELKACVAEHLAHFKVPERFWWQSGPLARGATDKIDRRAIRAACLSMQDSGHSDTDKSDTNKSTAATAAQGN